MTTMTDEAVPTVTDPVCRMWIDPARAAASEQHDCDTYYFCSTKCHNVFLNEPERYVTPR
jgi:P-type Cu+ transporter